MKLIGVKVSGNLKVRKASLGVELLIECAVLRKCLYRVNRVIMIKLFIQQSVCIQDSYILNDSCVCREGTFTFLLK